MVLAVNTYGGLFRGDAKIISFCEVEQRTLRWTNVEFRLEDGKMMNVVRLEMN